MIPTYNRFEYLGETLRSILAEDPGPELMQIAVVDDCSPDADPAQVLRELGLDQRVELIRLNQHVSISAAWNECLRHARGHWVHIMHSDDIVLPGYYTELRSAIERHPGIGIAYCRVQWMNADSQPTILGPLEMPQSGIAPPEVLEVLSITNRIQCPAVIVRRDVYEKLGGFRSDLHYTLDWEMWMRIAWAYPLWYQSDILFRWREHAGSETARLTRLNRTLTEIRECADIINSYIPAERRPAVHRGAMAEWGYEAVWNARRLLQAGLFAEAWRSLREAWTHGWCGRVALAMLKLPPWYLYSRVQKLRGQLVSS